MKPNSTQQEVLLMTSTNFTNSQWCAKDDDNQTNHPTEKEQLIEACWNGLLQELLPEICDQADGDKKLYLWQITEAEAFIELELGELPMEKDNYFSINPYSFLQMQSLS